MRVKRIIAEDFCNYKIPSMFIVTAECDWKCCVEAGIDIHVCQNAALSSTPTVEISNNDIFDMYKKNGITKAVVLGGLEPMLQFEELEALLTVFRSHGCNDIFVIYTGYYPEEIPEKTKRLRGRNVLVKYGRFIPNRPSRYDDLLGITLASDNQFSVKL